MSLCIVTPIKDAVAGPAHVSTVDFAIEYTRAGGRLALKTKWLSSNLARARMELVRDALGTEAEHVLFLDDDVVYEPRDVGRLLEAAEDVVSGIYMRRVLDGGPVGFELVGGEERGQLLEMQHIGLGFTLLRRKVLERLVEAHGDGVFEFASNGSRVVGEDQRFCERWRALGGRIWMHTDVHLGHVGPHIFR